MNSQKNFLFNTHSIWTTYTTDFLLLYFPGLVAILLSRYLPQSEESLLFLVIFFIAAGVLDSGHVYATFWRTYFLRKERNRLWVYWFAPPFFFFLFYLWTRQQWGYLAAAIVYSTVFHNIRQLIGISKWYQKKNKNWSRLSDTFLYLMCVIPFLAFHFRQDTASEHYYSSDELFRYPSLFWLKFCVVLYGIISILWITFEILRWSKYKEWNRIFSVLFSAIFYGYAFFLGRTATEVLFPLVVSHGFAYLAVMDLSLKKIRRPKLRGQILVTVSILSTAILWGGFEFFIESDWLQVEAPVKSFSTALLLTPLFSHYLYDSFLWKKSHPDSQTIYS